MKLITLLVLITGYRVQTFVLVNIDSIVGGDEAIEIRIPDPIKTSGPNRNQPILILPVCRDNRKLCAASALETYLKKTERIRDREKSLFLSFKKPFCKDSSQKLSRWKQDDSKEKRRIHRDIYGAQYTPCLNFGGKKKWRGHIETIRKTAGWMTGSLTFAKFYNLNVVSHKSAFATSVLKSK